MSRWTRCTDPSFTSSSPGDSSPTVRETTAMTSVSPLLFPWSLLVVTLLTLRLFCESLGKRDRDRVHLWQALSRGLRLGGGRLHAARRHAAIVSGDHLQLRDERIRIDRPCVASVPGSSSHQGLGFERHGETRTAKGGNSLRRSQGHVVRVFTKTTCATTKEWRLRGRGSCFKTHLLYSIASAGSLDDILYLFPEGSVIEQPKSRGPRKKFGQSSLS